MNKHVVLFTGSSGIFSSLLTGAEKNQEFELGTFPRAFDGNWNPIINDFLRSGTQIDLIFHAAKPNSTASKKILLKYYRQTTELLYHCKKLEIPIIFISSKSASSNNLSSYSVIKLRIEMLFAKFGFSSIRLGIVTMKKSKSLKHITFTAYALRPFSIFFNYFNLKYFVTSERTLIGDILKCRFEMISEVGIYELVSPTPLTMCEVSNLGRSGPDRINHFMKISQFSPRLSFRKKIFFLIIRPLNLIKLLSPVYNFLCGM